MAKKPSNKEPTPPRRSKGKSAGSGQSRKTRSPMPPTNARQAASGKRVTIRGGES